MAIWPRLALFLALTSLTFTTPTQSAVSSVDLGSEWMKLAVVNLKPGQTPISVAINEMSKRKSPALAAFHGGNRLVGEEAAGIAARYPEKVYSLSRDMIGKPIEYVKGLADSLYLPFDFVEDSRGQASVRIDDGVTVYTAEELVAMVLRYGVNLAEAHAKAAIRDVVITVPAYFGQAERRGLVQAAELAGINVLALLNEHSGAALQYGIDKDFSNQSRHVVFYDMGSSSTYAALVYFSAYEAKQFGKTVSVNQFQVKDVRWNAKLGGQDMEMRLVDYFAEEFNNQLGNGVDVRSSPKAMAKLKKQVKRTKEILSANSVAPISVESFYDDRDFRSSITREKFEELCGDLWEQSLLPIKELLTHSGLKADDIHAVEIIGGATRVPKLQATLQDFLGRKELDKHLDADEAIVLGAALHAANLSDGIKLNRKLGIVDGSPYGFMIELHGPDLLNNESSRQSLIQRMKKLPSKMFRSIEHNKDFEVSLFYESVDAFPPGVSSDKFAHYSVSGLNDAAEKYSSRNISSPIKANLHFSLSSSGILSLDRADAVIKISEWVEVPKKNLIVDNSTNTVPNNTSSEAGTETTSEGQGNAPVNEGVKDAANADSAGTNGVEKKFEKRQYRIPLKVVENTVGPGTCLSEKSLSEAKLRLEALDKKDAERRRTAELKNNLEGYIYTTREKLESMEGIKKISTESERQAFVEKLDEMQEWLYTDGEDAPATEFQQRLDLLKSVGEPIFLRLSELTARPAASEHARRYLTELQQKVSDWGKKKSWLPKARVDEVLSEAEKVKSWLERKEEEQKKTSDFSTPSFTSEEVYVKVFDLQDKVASVDRIPKPKPKVEKPQKNETADNGDKEKSSNSTSEESSSETNTPSEEPVDSSSSKEEPTVDEKNSESEPHDEL
ncbi:hypothetical protein Sjap_003746 [Stephania japonica]|uniref:Heat shock 70 kDa protein 17 n=1 Tax=Stephania japonica TaxID=461633 RepID=A0AAP0PXH6_9MAGN